MALKATRFYGTAVSHRVIVQDDANTTLNSNLGHTAGTLLSVVVNTGPLADAYVKIFDGNFPVVGTSTPQLIFRCRKGTTEVYEIPDGFAFTNLHAWATKDANPLDTTNPSSKTTVTLMIG